VYLAESKENEQAMRIPNLYLSVSLYLCLLLQTSYRISINVSIKAGVTNFLRGGGPFP
jgi:hypothetical protein